VEAVTAISGSVIVGSMVASAISLMVGSDDPLLHAHPIGGVGPLPYYAS
jgi:hypothetical protein